MGESPSIRVNCSSGPQQTKNSQMAPQLRIRPGGFTKMGCGLFLKISPRQTPLWLVPPQQTGGENDTLLTWRIVLLRGGVRIPGFY